MAIVEVGRGRLSTRVRFSKGTEFLPELGGTLGERGHTPHGFLWRVRHRYRMPPGLLRLFGLCVRLINRFLFTHTSELLSDAIVSLECLHSALLASLLRHDQSIRLYFSSLPGLECDFRIRNPFSKRYELVRVSSGSLIITMFPLVLYRPF